jgi:hypothetical protein
VREVEADIFAVATGPGNDRRWPSVTSPRLNRINSILIPPSCNFFSGSPSAKNSGVKRAWPGAISGWVTDREVFPGVQSEHKSA